MTSETNCGAAFYLLTHSQELLKPTNTGQLVKKTAPDTIVHEWSRLEPPVDLLEMLESDRFNPYLVFPESLAIYQQPIESASSGTSDKLLYILLDGTWQQARKMYRQSPYLHFLPLCQVYPSEKSVYDLRRNQTNGGLCTAEVIAEILGMEGKAEQSSALRESVANFCANHRYKSFSS
ncbi:MAG: tRNA-uridine aminocarboxypropyltransferase [Endozoicomonas sp.]|uniref:tRNA-uridine aminocarboxypropyltransferase n=1 Tax=Endozoicomonas sp. TaxID=1892382 RepID=UPI003D9B887D